MTHQRTDAALGQGRSSGVARDGGLDSAGTGRNQPMCVAVQCAAR